MKAPVCRICHKEHWLRDGCKPSSFLPDEPEAEAVTVLRDNPLLLEAIERLAVVEAQIAELREQFVNREVHANGHDDHAKDHADVHDVHADRAEYRREYMKKWRASQKAKQ